MPSTNTLPVFIGTYSKRGSEGLYVSQFDLASGELGPARLAAKLQDPTWLALHPRRHWLYSAGGVQDDGGRAGGAVNAFAVDQATGALAFMNSQRTIGPRPCHVAVDGSGRFAIGVSYSAGNATVFPIRDDGTLGEAVDSVQHSGASGVNPKRQEGPHAHSATFDRSNRFVVICDLGLDKLMVYRFDSQTGKLSPADEPFVTAPPGSGPRHFAFDSANRFAYLITELSNCIIVYAFDAARGSFRQLQIVSALPADFAGVSHAADVQIHPSGRFLYGSNRGHDSIVIFRIDETTGQLALVGHESTQGRNPRGFRLSPAGDFLLAANQDSDTIHVFRVNAEAGALHPTGAAISAPSPICLQFAAPPRAF